MNDKERSQRTLSRKIRLDRDGNFDDESRENEGFAWETATLRNCLVSSPMSFCYTERPNSRALGHCQPMFLDYKCVRYRVSRSRHVGGKMTLNRLSEIDRSENKEFLGSFFLSHRVHPNYRASISVRNQAAGMPDSAARAA